MTSQCGQCWTMDSSFLRCVLPIPATPPYYVGHFLCMAPPRTEDTRPEFRGSKRWRASRGDLGSLNGHQPEPVRISSAALAAQMAKGQPKRLNGIQRRRAPNVTHSAVWETRVRKTIQIIEYFAHRVGTRKLVTKRGAPNATHSVVSWT